MVISPPKIKAAALWPPEVDLILSAMDAASPPAKRDRRGLGRTPYRVRALLELFSDAPDDEPWVLYTRDVDSRGVGFITPHRLPLGYGGFIELFTPRGTKQRIACTLFRCREATPGWYEGALYFNREQKAFAEEG